jgi:hypothetical protein
MKKMAVVGFIAFLIFGAVGHVNASTFFDFNILPYPAGPSTIEAYMEGVYGSDITVVNAIVGNGVIPGPLGPDHHIQSNLSLGVDWFEIRFDETPITSASFDWGATWNQFVAEANGTVIFDTSYYIYESNFFSIDFPVPVSVLRFHDHCLGEVGIDNLRVASIPIPGSVWLLGSCVAGLIAMRRRMRP